MRKATLLSGEKVEKMAIILPTGQWYAPSAVINDAESESPVLRTGVI